MEAAHMTITLGNNHWSQEHQANAVVHPINGKEMEYMALLKDPRLQPLWTRGFSNKCGAFSRVFDTFLEPTHVSLSNSLTSQKTEISLTAK
jgi:hypothetical protein